MPSPNPTTITASHIDEVLTRSREVLILAPLIEAVPAQLQSLQGDLARLSVQVERDRQAFLAERVAFETERRKTAEASDFSATSRELELKDHSTAMTDLRGRLVALQNQIAAGGKRVEEIVGEIRKLERQFPDLAAGVENER